MERQIERYMSGMQGQPSPYPMNLKALREAAREALTPEAWGYLAGGAGTEATMRANRSAFDHWKLVPRMLRGPAERDLSVEVLGRRWRAPVMLAPIGVLSIIHEQAEIGAARAAHETNFPLALSTAASSTLEDVAEVMGGTGEDGEASSDMGPPRWFQLYWGKNDDLTASLVRRAEEAGYEALLVTLDTTMLAWRPRDLEQGYLPFLHGEGLANYFSDPAFRAALDEPPEENPTQAVLYFASVFSNPALTWDDLAFLREQTDLPLVLKGILHPDDARKARDHGAAGVVVSNHGGRQVDGAAGALHLLPDVADAVGEDLTVLFDSGIRTASDVIKAVALGAEAVLLGRPYCYGLAAGGREGMTHVLNNLLADLDLTLGLSGHASFDALSREALRTAD